MIMALGVQAKGRADGYLCTRQKRTRSRREDLCATYEDRYNAYSSLVPYCSGSVLYRYCTGTILGENAIGEKNRFPEVCTARFLNESSQVKCQFMRILRASGTSRVRRACGARRHRSPSRAIARVFREVPPPRPPQKSVFRTFVRDSGSGRVWCPWCAFLRRRVARDESRYVDRRRAATGLPPRARARP